MLRVEQHSARVWLDGHVAVARARLVHAVDGRLEVELDLGRNSPIVKHYPKIKNPCFVSCVNSAICS
jgi:hypothetical protein